MITNAAMYLLNKTHNSKDRALNNLELTLRKKWKDIEDAGPKWPDIPYHFGLGNIPEYNEMYSCLSDQNKLLELNSQEIRFMAYYEVIADLMIKDIGARGTPGIDKIMEDLRRQASPKIRRAIDQEKMVVMTAFEEKYCATRPESTGKNKTNFKSTQQNPDL